MDHSVGMNAALATVAALHKRRRTGQGSHVDVGAREVASSLAGDALCAASAGTEIGRMGNADPQRAPHGLYLTGTEDCWLSIAVCSDAEWTALARAMGHTDLADHPGFATAAARVARRSQLDDIVSEWARRVDGEQAARALQEVGVPAHVSWRAMDIADDPHLQQRGAVVRVAETGGRERMAVGYPAIFSVSDAPAIERPTPALGEHEDYVYGEMLGIGRAERARLADENVIF